MNFCKIIYEKKAGPCILAAIPWPELGDRHVFYRKTAKSGGEGRGGSRAQLLTLFKHTDGERILPWFSEGQKSSPW